MGTAPEQPADKSAWRSTLKQRLIDRSENPRDGDAVASRFVALCSSMSSVLLYAATPHESPTVALAQTLRKAGIRTAYPAIGSDTKMQAYIVEDENELAPDRFGILALTMDRRSEGRRLIPKQLDAVAVPGLGFDETTGVRLGRGGGYYDRFLARCPDVLRIGLAFDEQIVRGLPAEPHDIPMHAVITPTRTLHFV